MKNKNGRKYGRPRQATARRGPRIRRNGGQIRRPGARRRRPAARRQGRGGVPGRWRMRGVRVRSRVRKADMRERPGGEFAGRFIRARGINREDSPMFRVAVRHYNLIKPHGGPDCKTPAEAAGMEICSRNKWRTLVRNAAVARRPDADARRSSGDRRLLYGKPALESGRLGESRTLPGDFRPRASVACQRGFAKTAAWRPPDRLVLQVWAGLRPGLKPFGCDARLFGGGLTIAGADNPEDGGAY